VVSWRKERLVRDWQWNRPPELRHSHVFIATNPNPGGRQVCCLSSQPLCRASTRLGCTHCCFSLLVSPSVSPDLPCDRGYRSRLQHVISKNTQRISVDSLQQLQDLLQDGVSVYKMDIRGISLPGCQVYLFIDSMMYYLLL